MELIIVMMISSVIVGLSYYTIVNSKSMLQKKEASNNMYIDLSHLHTLIKKEFFNSNSIHYKEGVVTIKTQVDSIEYDFKCNDYILRNHTKQDTFYIQHGEPKCYYNSKQMTLHDQINKLEVPVLLHSDTLKLYYHKALTIKNELNDEGKTNF
jgi:hypothetical protein